MTKDEYFEWLKENRNKEERVAEKVVEEVLDDQLNKHYYTDYTPYFRPRHVLSFERPDGNKERIEFDLLIWLKHGSNSELDRIVSVEFKELDSSKVIKQAILRRHFVTYSYVAIKRGAYIHPEDIALLAYYGIGLVIWGIVPNEFAILIFPSKYRWQSTNFLNIEWIITAKLIDILEFGMEYIKKKDKYQQRNLFSYGGEEDE